MLGDFVLVKMVTKRFNNCIKKLIYKFPFAKVKSAS